MGLISTEIHNQVTWSQQFHRGRYLPEVMLLSQDNSFDMDLPLMMANDGTGHTFRYQTAQPTVQSTDWGEGTPESSSRSAKDREECIMISGLASVESEMANLHGQKAAARAAEDLKFLEAIRQLRHRHYFYGNRQNSLKEINGLATRYNSLTGVKAKQVFSCGGTTANAQTSVYFAKFGKGNVYGFFPEGTEGGYHKETHERQKTKLANGNHTLMDDVWHRQYQGLVVEDWRAAGRICNIEVSDLNALTGTQATTAMATNLSHAFLRMRRRIQRSPTPGKIVAFVNDTAFTGFIRLVAETSKGAVTWRDAAGQFGSSFQELNVWGIPVRPCDAILDTEGVVS